MNSTREMNRESNLTTEVQEGNMKKIIQVMWKRCACLGIQLKIIALEVNFK